MDREQSFFKKTVDIAIITIPLLMVIYHVAYARWLIQSTTGHDNTHLGFALMVTFLLPLREKSKRRGLWWVLIPLTLMSVSYVQYYMNDLMIRQGDNNLLDLVMGVILIIIVLEATRRAFGILLPALCSVLILYAFVGHMLPGPFRTVDIGWETTIARLSIGISGIYGPLLTVSSSYIFLFMVFASLITATGAIGFFAEIGKWISQRVKAGPALAAVITSGLVGSISGSAGSNVMITGSFTIPAMKRVGYKPEQAGGIEAAASTAGPIIPPVMGGIAFIMSGFLGIPYAKICLVAAIPAALYVISAAFYTYFQGEKMNVAIIDEKMDLRELLTRAPIFFIPLAVITILFIIGYSPMFVGFWACVTTALLGSIQKKTRPSFRAFIEALVSGANLGAKVGVSCALLGILVLTATMTGLGIRLPIMIEHLFAGNLIPLLFFTGVVSIILGCGLPSIAAYMLVAIVIAPALAKLGLSVLQAHLFVFFFANFSFITPPVAIAALFASQLAGATYIRTSIQAMYVGIAGFFLPFMIIFVPALMFDFSDVTIAVTTLLACPIIFLGLQSVIVGYFINRLWTLERIFLAASPLSLTLYICSHDLTWLALGLAIMVILSIWQIKYKREGVHIRRK